MKILPLTVEACDCTMTSGPKTLDASTRPQLVFAFHCFAKFQFCWLRKMRQKTSRSRYMFQQIQSYVKILDKLHLAADPLPQHRTCECQLVQATAVLHCSTAHWPPKALRSRWPVGRTRGPLRLRPSRRTGPTSWPDGRAHWSERQHAHARRHVPFQGLDKRFPGRRSWGE